MTTDKTVSAQDRGGSRASSPVPSSPELDDSIVEKTQTSPDASDESDAEVSVPKSLKPAATTSADSDAELDTESEPETDDDDETRAHAETEPAHEEPTPETKQSSAKVDAEPEAVSHVEEDAEFESEPEAKPEPESEPVAALSPELESDPESESENEPESESDHETGQDAVAQVHALPTEPSQSSTTQEQEAESVEGSEVETPKMTHDSMVTVRLSEPPALKLDTALEEEKGLSTHRKTQSLTSDAHTSSDESSVPRISTVMLPNADSSRSLQDELGECEGDGRDSDSSEDQEEVNWEELEKTEDEQIKEDEEDNVRGPYLIINPTFDVADIFH